MNTEIFVLCSLEFAREDIHASKYLLEIHTGKKKLYLD